jgi:hypothetical protein
VKRAAKRGAVVVVGLLALAGALGHRKLRIWSIELRLRHGDMLDPEARRSSIAAILDSGDDAAVARLARFVVVEREDDLTWLENEADRDPDHFRVMAPHLLRLAVRLSDARDRARAFEALERYGVGLADARDIPLCLHLDGRVIRAHDFNFFKLDSASDDMWIHAWADWFVAHDFIEPNAPVLAELGTRPREPMAIGLLARNVAEVVSSSFTKGNLLQRGDVVFRGSDDSTEFPSKDEVLAWIRSRVVVEHDTSLYLEHVRGSIHSSVGSFQLFFPEDGDVLQGATVFVKDTNAGRSVPIVLGDALRAWIVIPGCRADRAGLRVGDLLRTLDGRPVRDVAEIEHALEEKSSVEVAVDRPGEDGEPGLGTATLERIVVTISR